MPLLQLFVYLNILITQILCSNAIAKVETEQGSSHLRLCLF